MNLKESNRKLGVLTTLETETEWGGLEKVLGRPPKGRSLPSSSLESRERLDY